MQDKAITDALNRAFKDSPTNFNTVKGRNNYFKINLAERGCSAYCYVDCYQNPKMIELELVTIVVGPDQQPKVFKNKIEFFNKFKAERNGLQDIEVSFNRHPTQVELALIHLKFNYSEGKSKNKIALFSFNFETIEKKNDMILDEVLIKKTFVQAQWHPFFNECLIVLTSEGFEILTLLSEEGFYWTSSTSFTKIGVEEYIVDFRFWPSQSGLKQFTIIAAGQSGAIHLLLLALKPEQIEFQPQGHEIIRLMSPFSFKHYRTLKMNFNLGPIGCLGIQQSSPLSSSFLLLFRRVSTIKNATRSFILTISALYEENMEFGEAPLLIIRGEDQGPEFEIPQNCLYDEKFHFWCGEKFTRTNLKQTIAILNSSQSSIQRTKSLQKRNKTEILLEVPSKNFKFLIMEPTSIKILRKVETAHRYLFTSVAVEALILDLEEKNASKKLEALFQEISATIAQQRNQFKQVQVSSITSKIRELRQEADEREVDEVLRGFDSFIKQGQSILRKERAEIQRLYEQANSYTSDFQNQIGRWRDMDNLLSEIENNSRIIQQLERSSRQLNVHGGKVETIQQMTKCLVNRHLEISEKHRKNYQNAFEQQLARLQQIKTQVEGITEQLKQQNQP